MEARYLHPNFPPQLRIRGSFITLRRMVHRRESIPERMVTFRLSLHIDVQYLEHYKALKVRYNGIEMDRGMNYRI